jgi:hypothetical protein
MPLPRTGTHSLQTSFSWIRNRPWMLLSIPFLLFLALMDTGGPFNFSKGPLARVQVAALTMSNSEIRNIRTSSKAAPCSLSLWLVPLKLMKIRIQEEIDELAENRGPTFDPHVTVIGNIPCQSESDALEMAKRLQDGLQGFGKVPCVFSSGPFTSKGVWSQALFLTMEMSAPFMNLCQQSRALLGMDTENWTFAQPVGMPHLSLFYGSENIPEKSEVKPIAPFDSYTLTLWRTDPATLEGVPNWKEIAEINLR